MGLHLENEVATPPTIILNNPVLQTLLHVSVLLHLLQGALILCLLKLLSIKIIYNGGSFYGKICIVDKMW
jgi:hypothetical protein